MGQIGWAHQFDQCKLSPTRFKLSKDRFDRFLRVILLGQDLPSYKVSWPIEVIQCQSKQTNPHLHLFNLYTLNYALTLIYYSLFIPGMIKTLLADLWTLEQPKVLLTWQDPSRTGIHWVMGFHGDLVRISPFKQPVRPTLSTGQTDLVAHSVHIWPAWSNVFYVWPNFKSPGWN
jgi:hypothetical protein